MAHSYPEPKKERYGVLVIGLAIAVAAFALGWLAHLWIGPSDSEGVPTASEAEATQSASPDDDATVAGPSGDPLARCREVYLAQGPPLAAAAAPMAQWTEHINAMNQLVAGKITLAQATQYWDRTRAGARTRLEAYAAANRRFDARSVRCPRLGEQSVDATLRACTETVRTRHQELVLAGQALDTWRTHVHHMEMLRAGQLSPSRALELWVKSWRQGQAEVTRYRAAVREAQGLRC